MDLVQDVLDITSSYCFVAQQEEENENENENCIQNAKEETHRHLLSQEYNEQFSSPESSFQFLQDEYLIPLDFHPDIQNSLQRIHSKLKDTTPHSTQSYEETLKFLKNEKRYLQQIGTSQQIDGLHQMTGLVGISVALESSQMWFDLFTKSENPAVDGMHAIMDTAANSVSGGSKSNTYGGVSQQVPDAIANMDSGTAMTMLQGILSMIGQKGKDAYFDAGSGGSSGNGENNIDSNAVLNLVGSAVAGNVGGGGSMTENINLSVLQKVLSLVNGGIMPQQHTQQTQQGQGQSQNQGGGLFTSKVLIADYTAALAAVLAGIKKNKNGSADNNNNNGIFPSQQHTTYDEYDDDDGRSYHGGGSSIGMEQYRTREDEQGTTTNEYYDIMDTTHSSITTTTTTTTSNTIDTPSLIQKGLIASIPASAGALFWSALTGDLQFGSSNNNNNNNNNIQSSSSSNYYVNIDDDTIST